MSNLFIGVKRVVAVDSSEFAYAELEVDAHCMLVAQGNVGKSSLINAIRLFFLPECSMAKQAVNFGFADSNGDMYKSETTFNHYFPSKYSFLILEYEKRVYDGAHCCQILSASGSGRLKFERMFTQLSYAQLRHLFWQQGDDPDGIGERVSKLSKQNVYEYINKHDKHAILVKDYHKAASLLYEKELRSTKYTLFPLSEISEQSINSLRALIKLLFVASSKNKQPFTNAIANIIEGSKKSTQDQLGFSISEFKERHEWLKQQENHLNNIINEQKRFERLCQQKADFLEYLSILEQVTPGIDYLQSSNVRLGKELAQYASKKQLRNDKLSHAKGKLKQLEEDIKLANRELKNKNTELSRHRAVTNRHAQLFVEYPHFSNQEIIECLEEDIAMKQESLDVMSGSIKRSDALASIDNNIARLQEQLSKLQEALKNSEFDFAQQIDKTQLNWLHSINPILASANTGKELSSEQKAALDNFQNLFLEQVNHYQFFDSSIKHQTFARVNKQKQIDSHEQELNALNKQKRQLISEQDNVLHVEHSSKRFEQAIDLANKDIEVLKEFDYAAKRVTELQSEIDINQDSIKAFEHKQEAVIKESSDAETQYGKAHGEYQECQLRIQENESYLRELKEIATTYGKWLALLDDNVEFSGYVNALQIDTVKSSARNLQELQGNLITGLRAYIQLGIIEDKHGLMGDSPFWQEISACFDDVAETYGNLDTQRGLLGKQVEEHNQTIGTKKEVIVQNYRVIKAFEKDINRAFEGLTINNVSSVEFQIGINKQFEILVKEFEETNLYSNQMQSDEFYERLVAFAERFFDSNDNFTLTMDKVIESFEPRVQLINKHGKEDKKQSNSTNALIKIKLVQLLLKRMLAHDCETSFPIVHDEIANIDIGQFDWWLSDLSANGFNLIAAGTHSTSAELQAKIGKRFVIDALTTHLPYHAERNRVQWQGAEEFTTSDELSSTVQEELI